MWSALVSLFLGAIKWLWGGRQQAEGKAQGQAEKDAANLRATLENAQKADEARRAASNDDLASAVLHDPNNKGPG